MACWRLLGLSETADVPQLLIKPDFRPESYTVFLTDLSNIWSEELDLADIVDRASQHDSPIEVTAQDTAQLAILLEHVQQSLSSDRNDSSCRITKDGADGLVLHTTNNLPKPLGSLTWSFNLRKRTCATLKNELILPLLVSSHIQHERVNRLTSIIQEKDGAITRFLDQFESSNMDLASAFPSIAGWKPGRRLVKRDQAAQHIPALRPFQEEEWKSETAQLKDGQLSTLRLFQDALSECNPKVPSQMKTEDVEDSWWTSIQSVDQSGWPTQSTLDNSKVSRKPKQKTPSPPPKLPAVADDDETETEDEFETHENFKLREPKENHQKARETTPAVEKTQIHANDTETESDDDDLDAPPKSQSQRQSQSYSQSHPRVPPSRVTAEPSPPPKSPSPEAVASPPKKATRFRIGGARAKRAEKPKEDDAMPEAVPTADATIPKPRKTFKIGGKNKTSQENPIASQPASPSPNPNRSRSVTVDQGARAVGDVTSQAGSKMGVPEEAEREETADEKAERKRLELKRKNEDYVKKQAQKKKKRF